MMFSSAVRNSGIIGKTAMVLLVVVLALVSAVWFMMPSQASADLGQDNVCEVFDELNEHMPGFPGCEEDTETPPTCDENQHLEGNICVANETPDEDTGGEENENTDSENTSSTDTETTSNTSGGGGLSGGGSMGGIVLGASTDEVCADPLLTSYLGLGKKNDLAQVVKLQLFLNSELGLTIPVTGVFGSDTKAAVEKFQVKYANEVLTPWAPFGLTNATPTGYVYKTTMRMINKIHCAALDVPMPLLP